MRVYRTLSLLLVLGLSLAATCQTTPQPAPSKAAVTDPSLPPAARAAMKAIDAQRIKAHVQFLSSDLLEGRGTGQRGGDVAAHYLASQFQSYGLKPAGDDGTFLQKVPMVGVTTKPESKVSLIQQGDKTIDLRLGDDVIFNDQTQSATDEIDAPLVFVGYGIEAPEYKWDDYKGVDVAGKMLLMLVNEPPSSDESFFKGKALTYYGRWTYKYEEAARKGAVGVILIHKTEMASYGWDVVRNSWSGERSYLREDANPKLKLAAWVQLDVARKMLADAGKDLDQLMKDAQQRGFKPVPLPIKAEAHVVSNIRPFSSNNVIGEDDGSDPKLKDQAVVITAHYDHLGIRPELKGDNIYNGALDNASGTAMLMEMARAAASAQLKPKRSIIFAAVTGEEQGLLGSEYLGQHPPVADGNISLNINFDSIAPLGIP